MSWHPQPRRIRVDGTDAVVLTADAYDRLDTIRRQAGAQAHRVHALREQLAGVTALLDAIRQAAALSSCAHDTGEDAPTCLRETVLALLGPGGAVSCGGPGRPAPDGGLHRDQNS
jgi:hypothetical protein